MSIYRKAAKRIANGKDHYACDAVRHLTESGSPSSPEALHFSEYFKPEELFIISWFGYAHDEKNRLARSLALLFMAEIEKEQI